MSVPTRKFLEAFSLPGDANPPVIDVPTQRDGSFVIVTQVEVMIRTQNGRKRIGSKDVFIDRYPADMPVEDRTEQNRLSNYRIPICGPRNTEVNYSRMNNPYTSVADLETINRLGFRVCVDQKDRPEDEQWVRVAVESYVFNELESQLR